MDRAGWIASSSAFAIGMLLFLLFDLLVEKYSAALIDGALFMLAALVALIATVTR